MTTSNKKNLVELYLEREREFENKPFYAEFLHGVPVEIPGEAKQEVKFFHRQTLLTILKNEVERLDEKRQDLDPKVEGRVIGGIKTQDFANKGYNIALNEEIAYYTAQIKALEE